MLFYIVYCYRNNQAVALCIVVGMEQPEFTPVDSGKHWMKQEATTSVSGGSSPLQGG